MNEPGVIVQCLECNRRLQRHYEDAAYGRDWAFQHSVMTGHEVAVLDDEAPAPADPEED